ncbi:hypothetical protein CJ030_MR8G010109 [Morella rubra]|uniref:Phorbol-ester/DAG-type domain-containing protein n=1 Tax=Morella rubra TaxID=262757 RepID=A0A6A1UPE9_9ROSI|nr:hypothetical protein CJ030_MR8G010109 [Morella rubra]
MEVQHIIHKHPLIFNEQLQNDRTRQDCCWCMETSPIVGSNYSCKECSWFILHKSCAESPRELHHLLHPKHPLILHAHQKWFICDGCNGLFQNWSYYCSHCNFNLDPKCASLRLTKESLCHDHPLTLVRKLLPFTCDFCGEEGEGMFYICTTCPFVVHPNCSSLMTSAEQATIDAEIHDHPLILCGNIYHSYVMLVEREIRQFYFCASCSFVVHQKCISFPKIVKVVRHKQHPLNLIYSLQDGQSHHKVCQICAQIVDTNYGLYYCSSCNFLVHLHCAMTKEERDQTFVPRLKDTKVIEEDPVCERHEKSIDLPPYVVKNSKRGVDGIEIDVEIQHFSHNHHLMLTNEPDINEQCDGLHFDDLFRCNACRRESNGFSYCCEDCDVDLDVKCASISNIFTHDSHVHKLILSSASGLDICSGCDSATQYGFRCGNCKFMLDFKCATLQHSTSYGPHEHPFILCYSAEDDSDGVTSSYYCADCSYPAHLNCILGKFPNIKFGKTYKVDIHEHLLTLVQKTWDHPSCKICKDPCEDLTLECAECNFSAHRSCCV